MIDFILNNPKLVLYGIGMPIVIIMPVMIYTKMYRNIVELETYRQYIMHQLNEDSKVSERIKAQLAEIKVGSEIEVNNVIENLNKMTVNNDNLILTVKNSLENLPVELTMKTGMYMYIGYIIGLIIYKMLTTTGTGLVEIIIEDIIDIIINNPKTVLKVMLPFIVVMPLVINSIINRKEKEITILKEYRANQIENDKQRTMEGESIILESKNKLTSIQQDMAGDENTIAEFSKVIENLEELNSKLNGMAANHATMQGTFMNDIEDIPAALDIEDIMYIYGTYTVGVLIYKWWKTGTIVDIETEE